MPRTKPSTSLLRALFRRSLSLVGAFALVAVSGIGRADDAALAEAQKRFQEGLPLMDAGKFEEARLKFLQAVAVLKAPSILYNLASTELKTGHEVEAVGHYRAFLLGAATDTRITDAMREKAKQNIAELLKKVGQLDIHVPEGAKVSIDGVPNESDLKEPVPVVPGSHKVDATFGGRVKSATVDARLGEVTRVTITSESSPSVTAVPAEPKAERTTLGLAVPIGLGAVGLVAAGLGAGFLVDSNNKADKADAFNQSIPGGACTAEITCRSYDAKSEDASNSRTVSTVAFVGAGVFLLGAIGSFVFWPSKKSESVERSATSGLSRPRFLPLLGSTMGVQGIF